MRAGGQFQSLRCQMPLHLIEQLLAQIMRFERGYGCDQGTAKDLKLDINQSNGGLGFNMWATLGRERRYSLCGSLLE